MTAPCSKQKQNHERDHLDEDHQGIKDRKRIAERIDPVNNQMHIDAYNRELPRMKVCWICSPQEDRTRPLIERIRILEDGGIISQEQIPQQDYWHWYVEQENATKLPEDIRGIYNTYGEIRWFPGYNS